MGSAVDKTITVWKLILVTLLVIGVGWLAATGRFNIGALIDRLMGKDRKAKTPKLLGENHTGKVVQIKENRNPLRDKSIIELEDGECIQLPKGIIDEDVASVIKVRGKAYGIKTTSDILTSVFDDPTPDGTG